MRPFAQHIPAGRRVNRKPGAEHPPDRWARAAHCAYIRLYGWLYKPLFSVMYNALYKSRYKVMYIQSY